MRYITRGREMRKGENRKPKRGRKRARVTEKERGKMSEVTGRQAVRKRRWE